MTTSLPSRLVTTTASISSGSSPAGNSTSTTTPITRVTFPTAPSDLSGCSLCASWAIATSSSPTGGAQGFRAAHDVHQLRRDRFLAHLVRGQRQVLDEVTGRV